MRRLLYDPVDYACWFQDISHTTKRSQACMEAGQHCELLQAEVNMPNVTRFAWQVMPNFWGLIEAL